MVVEAVLQPVEEGRGMLACATSVAWVVPEG